MIAPTSHSAVVQMELLANGLCIPLAQMSRDYVIPREPIDLPPCSGEVVLSIDGSVSRTRVSLPEGGASTHSRIPLAACADQD